MHRMIAIILFLKLLMFALPVKATNFENRTACILEYSQDNRHFIVPSLSMAYSVISLQRDSYQEERETTGWVKPSLWVLGSYLLSGLSILLAARMFYGHEARLKRHREQLEEFRADFQNQAKPAQQNFQLDELKKIVKQLVSNDPAIDGLEKNIRGLQQLIESPAFAVRHDNLPVRQEMPEIVSNPIVSDAFYMSYPVQGSFSLQSKSAKKENTIYRFRPIANGGEAEFELHTEGGVPIRDLISGVERFIRSGCVEGNLPRPDTIQIITNKSGLAVLQGDRWNIIRKAEIIYG